MVEKMVRCPYCVLDDDFRRMISHVDGSRFFCNKCGHLARPTSWISNASVPIV